MKNMYRIALRMTLILAMLGATACSEGNSNPPDSGVTRDSGTEERDLGTTLADAFTPVDGATRPDATVTRLSLVVNELQPRGDDFAEIVNTGIAPASLDGYFVADAEGIGEPPADVTHRVALPAGLTLAPGEHFVVAMNLDTAVMTGIVTTAANCRGAARCVQTAFGMSAGSGDSFAVLDAAGAVVAEAAVPGAATGDDTLSWSRLPDATGGFSPGMATPGAVNAAAP